MIKRISIQGFFSFREETSIELNKGVNLMLGINGSGKTSFINALRVLSEGVAGGGLMKLIQEQWGGYDEIINVNGKTPSPFARLTFVFDRDSLNAIHTSMAFSGDVHYRITVHRSGSSYYLGEKLWISNDRGRFFLLDFQNGIGKISTRNSDEGKISLKEISGYEISGQELVLRQINDPVHYLPVFVLRKAIESIVAYSGFHVGEDSRLRRPAEYVDDRRLKRSGTNLALVINDLKLKHTFDFEKLEDTFRKVNPNFKSIEIATPYGKTYLSLREENMGRTIGASHISDGTLRFLLMESIFYNPERGSIVAVDEPERGMHPDMIRSVADMIRHAAQTSQLIVATHSPHLLNQFSLDDILVFEKTPHNVSTVHKVKAEDFSDSEEDDLLPGQMWLLGQIGGKRW